MEPLKDYHLIAPDLMGMGDSDKLNEMEGYLFESQAAYLDSFIDCAVPADKKVVLVVHDWGSALGYHWAYRHQDRVQAIAYMEGSSGAKNFADLDPASQQFFGALRSEAGETMILEQNMFIEQILPGQIIRNLTTEEMDVYRAPYLEAGESRRPILTWAREVPLDGIPANVFEIVETFFDWMDTNEIPKLFVNAEPGSLLSGENREIVRQWKNQTEVTVAGLHFIQEDSPEEIADAIADWLPKVLSSPEEDMATDASGAFANHSMPFVYIALVWIMLIRKAIW